MIKNEPYYLDRLANAETLCEAANIAQLLASRGTNEAYPAISKVLTRLAFQSRREDPNEWPILPPGWELEWDEA